MLKKRAKRGKYRPKSAQYLPLTLRPAALIVADLQRWQAHCEQFKTKERPRLQKQADRAGVILETTEYMLMLDGVMVKASITHRFKRRPTLPRSKRWKCGARCRSGELCRATVCLKKNGRPAMRCRLHGGRSTGPTTVEGRARIAESNRARAARKRELQAAGHNLKNLNSERVFSSLKPLA